MTELAEKLMANPRLYATFLLWLLSELFEELPEVGDAEKPSPEEGEILIKVVATSINRPDLVQRQGNYPPPAG